MTYLSDKAIGVELAIYALDEDTPRKIKCMCIDYTYMSFRRAKSRTTNRNTYYDNALTSFTNPPIQTGDLHVRGDLTVGRDLRSKNFYATGNYFLNNYVLIPAGTIIQSAAINVPGGWFSCNGDALLANMYSALFDAIGYTFGGEEGEFNLPNMNGRVAVGSGGGYNLGVSGGEATHTLTTTEIPSHSHSLTRRSNPDAGSYDTDGLRRAESSAATTDRNTDGSFNTGTTGGGLPHNNMQPYVVLRYLIKW